MKLHSFSPEQTFNIGVKIGKVLKGNELILLSAGMGLGKTLFSKGIAQSVGINPQEIVSPTFTLVNHFKGRFQLFHIDLYRLGDHSTQSLPEIDDSLGDGIIIVEWAQYLDTSYFNLDFSVSIFFNFGKDENSRVLKIDGPDYLKLNRFE